MRVFPVLEAAMAAALEDGEVLESDSGSEADMRGGPEPGPRGEQQIQQAQVPNLSARPLSTQNEAAGRLSSYDVRSRYRTTVSDDSSEDSDCDSEEEDRLQWKRKRQKCSDDGNNLPLKPPAFPFGPFGARQIKTENNGDTLGRKVNNVWGAVLQEQNQDAVATELGILGMEGNIDMNSRQSETYNYALAKKMMEKQEEEEESAELAKLEAELDEYVEEGKSTNHGAISHAYLKRKRPVKERLGERLEMEHKGRYEITEDDGSNKISEEIAYRLREPKADLIHRVVKSIGKRKAIELLMETSEVEQNGGILTMDGSRRRTPGGVYLNLLKNMPSITHDQIKEIFYDENQKYNNRKAAKKRRRHLVGKKVKQAIKDLNLQVDDDTSRETFASDTNDALASVEDTEEHHTEKPVEDPEDAIELDNSNDLEIF
ncbi:phosphorylated adapter RNA export protein [Callorhinchus milii]|uniref:Phosphorylated adapter RNA export protein n=2 Tax=Callorhinchus milii TaxID=7868 RepID=A0A4W3IRE7_CALMI|nr:phosphorylated adapter RNA export protein [Callorhinchus milii]|eukprot:gi/632962839/ref/XP_007897546.1/ PREDICTED: phosphorylated adapter RNA export protein [Callorhinchus milii]